MPARTGAQLVNEVLAYGFDATSYSGRVTFWLSDAAREIARKYDLPVLRTSQTITTVSGTSSHALPADFARERNLRLDAYTVDLTPIEVRDFDELPTASGLPECFTIEGSNLLLWPTPSDSSTTLTLRYIKLAADVAADNNVTTLGQDLDPILVHYAVAQCYASEDDAQMHQFHVGEYTRLLNSVAADLRYQIGDGPKQVPGTWAQLGEYSY